LHNGSYVFNCANNLNDYQIFGNKTQTLQWGENKWRTLKL
jgi:hypothetical protein